MPFQSGFVLSGTILQLSFIRTIEYFRLRQTSVIERFYWTYNINMCIYKNKAKFEKMEPAYNEIGGYCFKRHENFLIFDERNISQLHLIRRKNV